MTDNDNRLFGVDDIQGKFDRIGEHGNSQERMEDLHQVRPHPSPLSCRENDGYNSFQSATLFERNLLFYTTFNAFSSTLHKIFPSSCGRGGRGGEKDCMAPSPLPIPPWAG